MEYREFTEVVKNNIDKILEKENVDVKLDRIVKSGDHVRDGLILSRNDSMASPLIYLDDFYDMYTRGADIDFIINKIIEVYRTGCPAVPPDLNELVLWERAREQITCRVMNRNLNRKYLEDAVYYSYLDLAVVMYCTFIHEDRSIYSCKITESILKDWGVGKEEVYETAKENTVRMFGICLEEIADAFADILGEIGEENSGFCECVNDPDRIPMYILTNSIRNQGAVNMFIGNTLKELADRFNDDLYIIPSSVHEVMIIPAGSTENRQELNAMIRDINLNMLEPQSILANHLYIYSREEDRIIK